MEKTGINVLTLACALTVAVAAVVYLSNRAANQPTELEQAVDNFADSVGKYQETQRLLNRLD